jgi:hypothetical protein
LARRSEEETTSSRLEEKPQQVVLRDAGQECRKRNSGPLHGVLERAPRLAHVTEPVLRVLESRPVAEAILFASIESF